MRTRSSLIAIALAAVLLACNGVSKLDLTRLGRGSWQRPEDVVVALALSPGDRVADIGAGEGYFIPYLADAVGAKGRVYAVDIDPELTQRLEERFVGEGSPVRVILGRPDDPELPNGSVDVILIVNTYHHIEDRETYFVNLKADLSPSGRVAIIEPDSDLSGVLDLFTDEGHTSSARDIVREMQNAGYRQSERFDFLATEVFEVFVRGRDDS